MPRNDWDFGEHPSLFAILAGRQAYGMSPELETRWCWTCLVLGLFMGWISGMSLMAWAVHHAF